jgi:hypothetical protein
MHIVGAVAYSSEQAQDDIDGQRDGGPLFPPALTRLLAGCCAAFAQTAVQLAPGTSVAAAEAGIEGVLPRGFPVEFYSAAQTQAPPSSPLPLGLVRPADQRHSPAVGPGPHGRPGGDGCRRGRQPGRGRARARCRPYPGCQAAPNAIAGIDIGQLPDVSLRTGRQHVQRNLAAGASGRGTPSGSPQSRPSQTRVARPPSLPRGTHAFPERRLIFSAAAATARAVAAARAVVLRVRPPATAARR